MFLGPVGAGKSTQIRLLGYVLKRRVFLKTSHLLAYALEVFWLGWLVGEGICFLPGFLSRRGLGCLGVFSGHGSCLTR